MTAGASAYARYLWLSATFRSGQARSWRIGAAAEAATAQANSPLKGEGWHFLYDRALPRSKANLDGLAVTPCGSALALLETKHWRTGNRVDISPEGELTCGKRPQNRDVNSLLYEVSRTRAASPAPVIPIIVVRGASVSGGHIRASFPCPRTGSPIEVDILEARHLPLALRSMVLNSPDKHRASRLAAQTKRTFPPRAPWPARLLARLFLREE